MLKCKQILVTLCAILLSTTQVMQSAGGPMQKAFKKFVDSVHENEIEGEDIHLGKLLQRYKNIYKKHYKQSSPDKEQFLNLVNTYLKNENNVKLDSLERIQEHKKAILPNLKVDGDEYGIDNVAEAYVRDTLNIPALTSKTTFKKAVEREEERAEGFFSKMYGISVTDDVVKTAVNALKTYREQHPTQVQTIHSVQVVALKRALDMLATYVKKNKISISTRKPYEDAEDILKKFGINNAFSFGKVLAYFDQLYRNSATQLKKLHLLRSQRQVGAKEYHPNLREKLKKLK